MVLPVRSCHFPGWSECPPGYRPHVVYASAVPNQTAPAVIQEYPHYVKITKKEVIRVFLRDAFHQLP